MNPRGPWGERFNMKESTTFGPGRQWQDLNCGDLTHISTLLDAAEHELLKVAIQNSPLRGRVRRKQRGASRGLYLIAGIREHLVEIL
jgi:hypothetical protein